MSKDKKLRKIIIDKLFHKGENLLKQSTRSNAPTESTPNEPKNFSKAIQNFFSNFQAQCAIIYEPVKVKDHRPLKRPLEEQLNFLFQYDKRFNFKTQESQSLRSSNLFKNQSHIVSNGNNRQKICRMQTQNSNCQSKSRQNKLLNTDVRRQGIFKSRSMIFSRIPTSESQLVPKQKEPKHGQLENTLSRQSSQSIKMQKTKSIYMKIMSNTSKQQNQYMTNSKYVPSKYVPRNAPVKPVQKPQKFDRIKRIQSLKNLNQNGARKYSYQRQL